MNASEQVIKINKSQIICCGYQGMKTSWRSRKTESVSDLREILTAYDQALPSENKNKLGEYVKQVQSNCSTLTYGTFFLSPQLLLLSTALTSFSLHCIALHPTIAINYIRILQCGQRANQISLIIYNYSNSRQTVSFQMNFVCFGIV